LLDIPKHAMMISMSMALAKALGAGLPPVADPG